MADQAGTRGRVKRAALATIALSVAFPIGVGADGSAPGVGVFSFSNEVEGSLVRAIVGLRESGLRQAMGEIDQVLARNPNFRLGHLIQGDLLMARAGNPVAFGAMPATATASIAPLQDEAKARLKRYLDAPPVDYLPAPLLQMAPSQEHAIVVDTKRSRLFVFANHEGRPRYVTDFYISLGKNGVDKQREGDQKTPTGVYTVVSMKEKNKLPDFYGPGAYPINYPNEWDKRQGRNGYGIWLHGTPSETYSRPPFATDGCVVLTNDDFNRLSRYVNVGRTPVVISQQIEWRDMPAWDTDRKAFLAAFEQWRADWESRDVERYLTHYGNGFPERDSWAAKKRKVAGGKSWVKVGIAEMSLFADRSNGLMVVTFEQDYRSNNLSNKTLKRQYWQREGSRWRIVHESVAS